MFNQNTRNSKGLLIDEQEPNAYFQRPLVSKKSIQLQNVEPRTSGSMNRFINVSNKLRDYEITKDKGRNETYVNDRLSLTTPYIRSGGDVEQYNMLLAKESSKVCHKSNGEIRNKCRNNDMCDRGNIDENYKFSSRIEENGNMIQNGFSSNLEKFCCTQPIDTRLEMQDKYDEPKLGKK